MIDKAWIDEQMASLRSSRDRLLAQLNAHEGALQTLALVRRRCVEEPEEVPAVEAPETESGGADGR